MSDEELAIPGTETYAERVACVFGSLGPQNQEPKRNSEDDTTSSLHCLVSINESRKSTSSLQRRCDREELPFSHGPAKPRRLYTHRGFSSRYVPDYIKHPERWVKYDLKNDGTERMAGMSADQQNREAALEFLQMRTASATKRTNNAVDTGTVKSKVKLSRCNAPHEEVTCSRGSNMMKEYVVGAKREKKLKRNQQRESTPDHVSSVHLSYLEDSFSD